MPLTDEAIEELLNGAHVAILATVGPDGRPHQVPVWYRWRDGVALLWTERKTQKARNLGRDPRFSLCIDTKEPPYVGAIIHGTARELEGDYTDERRLLWEHYAGVERAAEVIAERPFDPEVSTVFELTPERIISFG